MLLTPSRFLLILVIARSCQTPDGHALSPSSSENAQLRPPFDPCGGCSHGNDCCIRVKLLSADGLLKELTHLAGHGLASQLLVHSSAPLIHGKPRPLHAEKLSQHLQSRDDRELAAFFLDE